MWFHKQKCPRPPAKWQKKDPKEKGKRKRNPNPPKTSKKANGNTNFKSDAQTPASDDSSPADTATEAPDTEETDPEALQNDDFTVDEGEPTLPPMPHSFRASSADPGPRGLHPRSRGRATGRQVQSSPGQAHGSEGVPIEIDLTPKPVRRQLFPSPEKTQVRSDPGPAVLSQTSEQLPSFVRRSPRLNKIRDAFGVSAETVEVAVDGKENVAPMTAAVDDGLGELFEEGPIDVELPPMTPTPKRRSERLLLKTPSKTPQRHFGAELEPNVEHRPSFRTPKPKPEQHPALAALLGTVQKNVLDMTPFSRSIHDALTSDIPLDLNAIAAQVAATEEAKKDTPRKTASFDFPDLPSLKNSSPMSSDQLINFHFSEMTTDQLNSDLHDAFATSAMPSSPPAGLFSYLDTHEVEAGMDAIWGNLVRENATSIDGHSSYPDPEALAGAGLSSQGTRKSPRRQKLK